MKAIGHVKVWVEAHCEVELDGGLGMGATADLLDAAMKTTILTTASTRLQFEDIDWRFQP